MAYIETGIPQAGIVELLFYKGETGKALSTLAHTLLHTSKGLAQYEREMIAAHVSKLNDCEFCHNSHGAVVTELLQDDGKTLECVVNQTPHPKISPKMQALLRIAGKVQQSGRAVMPEDVEAARSKGATDEEIHDTVLIAAAFCMYNRYVDGLATTLPQENSEYGKAAVRLANKGYLYPPQFLRKWVVKMMNKKPMALRQPERKGQ